MHSLPEYAGVVQELTKLLNTKMTEIGDELEHKTCMQLNLP